MIAEAYGIGLDDLLALNHLPKNAVIFPQQELIIRPAYTITPTVEPSHTATLLPPTSTRRPTRTPTAIQKATITPTSQPTETQTKVRAETDILGNVLLVAIAVLVIVGTALILVGMVLKRTP